MGLILLTVYLSPVPTASIFFVLLLIYYDLAAKNLNKINKIPFSSVSKLSDLLPLGFNLVNVLFALFILFFEVINDFGDFLLNLIKF